MIVTLRYTLYRYRLLQAVEGAVVHDLTILDGLDNGIVLDGIAVLVELQVAGDQAGDLQAGQSVTDSSAVSGVGSLDGTAAM